MKLGVLKFSALGDIALALPFLRALTVKPTILTTPAGHALLDDEFESFIILKSKKTPDILRFIRALRRERLDVLIDLQNNDRSRLITRLSAARRRHERSFPRHTLGALDATHAILAPTGLLGALDTAFDAKPRDYIVLNAGSSPAWHSKRLPDTKWREISALLQERFNLPFILTGSADERDYIQHLARQLHGKTENRAGATTLLQLKHLLRDAYLTVSTDSAAMQLSAAMKTPTIGIFGATNWQRSAPFGPWSRTVHDPVYYPDGVPPETNTREPLPFYDHIDIAPALDSLAPYLI